MSVLIISSAMPAAILGKFEPMGDAENPISLEPVELGLRSAFNSSLSPSPVRGTESVSASSLMASFFKR
jgi:hypothetical protein